MIIKGNNILTTNNSNLVKNITIKHNGTYAEIKTTKRGLAICIYGKDKIVKNGDTLLILNEKEEVHDFEKVVIDRGTK